MGKRKKHGDLNDDGGVPTPVEDEGMVGADVKVKRGARNRRDATASLVNEADMMAERDSQDAVVAAGEGGKRTKRSTGQRSAQRSREEASSEGGEVGGKATFSWTPANEIVVLSELLELAKGHGEGKSGINWWQLAAIVGERLGFSFTRTQIYEKARRLRERFTKLQRKEGKLSNFKNDDDEKMYTLSDQIWGTTEVLSPRGKEAKKVRKPPKQFKQAQGPLGALRLHLEEEHDVAPGEAEKQVSDQNKEDEDESTLPNDEAGEAEKQVSDQNKKDEDESTLPNDEAGEAEKQVSDQNKKDEDESTLPNDEEVGTPRGSDFAHLNEPNHGADVQANPDVDAAAQSKAQQAFEGDIQKAIEVFRVEHRALLKELEKRCAMVVEDMQTKLLSMMTNSVRGSQFPWIGSGGGGGNVSSFGIVAEMPCMWDKLVGDSCASRSAGKPAAAGLDDLYEQWQQQRLQELKLTSMRLHLMLEDCKMEREKLEKQGAKPK